MKKINDIQEFGETILKMVREKADGAFSTWLTTGWKNNGLEKLGITTAFSGNQVEPCVYLEGYFAEYQHENMGLEEAAEEIYHVIMKAQDYQPDINIADLLQWDTIKSQIQAMLINTEMNSNLLKEIPCRLFLDLSVAYYIPVNDMDNGTGIIRIRNEHLSVWGQEEEALYQAACENMKTSGRTEFFDMKTLFPSCFPPSTGENVNVQEDFCMFVLTNQNRCMGAGEIINEETLRKIYDQIGAFVLLPSSVHEVIIIPDHKSKGYEPLADMVKEINADMVLPEERLSDHVYVYDKNRGALRIAA